MVPVSTRVWQKILHVREKSCRYGDTLLCFVMIPVEWNESLTWISQKHIMEHFSSRGLGVLTYSGVPNSQTRLTINTVEKKSQMFFYLLQ